jgi:Zn-dependent peptidase ImmA (M78 family)
VTILTSRVPVNAELLKWAYNRSNKKDILHNRFKKLDEWLDGDLSPTLRQLEDFSNATSTPLGYFFLQHPPEEELPIPHYRSVRAGDKEKSSPDLIETLYTMQRRQDFMKDYFEKYTGEPLSYVSSYKDFSAVELANKICDLLEIEKDWARKLKNFQEAFRYLIDKCERQRILVMVNGIVGSNTHRPLNVEEFRGFVLVDDMAPLIFINGADAKSAQIFTLIHEVAHILIGSSAIVEASPLNVVDESVEKLCNAATAEVLCPSIPFIREWHTHYGDGVVYKTLGKVFKVSSLVIARRALELRCITKKEFFEFYEQYLEESMEKSSASSGGDFYNTTRIRLGDLFSKAVIYETRTGNIQYTDAYKLTGLKGSTYQKYMDFIYERGV